MVTWIPSIYPQWDRIYTSTMDPMGTQISSADFLHRIGDSPGYHDPAMTHQGVYRTHSRLADKAAPTAPTAASRQSLVTLDHLWWRIRDHLDGYLAVAESEVRHIQRSFVALSDYENCQSDSEGLLKSYASSISKMKKGHRNLKSTWREAQSSDFSEFLLTLANCYIIHIPTFKKMTGSVFEWHPSIFCGRYS